jgi:hypothetical protein
LKDNNPPVEAVAQVAKKPKKPKKVDPADITKATPPTGSEVKPGEQSPVKTVDGQPIVQPGANVGSVTNPPPIENINMGEKPKDMAMPMASESPKDNVVKVEEPKLNLGETKVHEKEIDKQIDMLIEKDNSKDLTKAVTSEMVKSPDTAKAIDLKDKIAVEETYVAPPTYEAAGRGLVYNCTDKFWVCVDKPSYVTCNKNMKYNKSQNKKAECAVVNVYNSQEDCSVIQKYYVSSNKSTEFCN